MQQLAPESKTGEANIDASTALTSKYNENFLKDRLFKRKKARLTKSNNNVVNGGKKEEKPFLLFDPLLDKAPKKKAEAKPLTRAEMEERLRFRKSGKRPSISSGYCSRVLKAYRLTCLTLNQLKPPSRRHNGGQWVPASLLGLLRHVAQSRMMILLCALP